MNDADTLVLWEELIGAYANQIDTNHTAAARVVGCKQNQAARLYNKGHSRTGLGAIKDIVGSRQAANRAIREAGAGDEELRLVDAQADARRVSFQEGQMIAATRMSISGFVHQLRDLMKTMAPVMTRMQKDVEAMAKDEDSDGNKITFSQRHEAVREIVWLQRQAAKMVKMAMDLERKYNNEPTAIIGVELGTDVSELLRSALESAAALEHTAALIDVTPDVKH